MTDSGEDEALAGLLRRAVAEHETVMVGGAWPRWLRRMCRRLVSHSGRSTG